MDLVLIARVLSRRKALRAREHWSTARMAAYRAEQLRSLRAHAYANSPFYRRFHRGYETTPLDQLPVLTKTAVMRNFDELTGDSGVRLAHVLAHLETLQQDELFFGKYRVMRTSGSTGQPGIFLNDPRE